MSTRAVYTFTDPETKQKYHVYKHHDGYPKGAAIAIENAQPHAWKQGRFEADEFAAAFVAGNKSGYITEELELLRKHHMVGKLWTNEDEDRLIRVRDYARSSGGGMRLMQSGSIYAVAPCDIEWRYEITSIKGALQVAAYSTSFWEIRSAKTEKRQFKGTFEAFKVWADEVRS